MAKDAKPNLLDVLRQCGADELTEVRQQITALVNQLESLKAVEKILSIKVEGKPEKQPRGTSTKLAEKIHDCIQKNGPGFSGDIALKIGSTAQAVGMCVAKSNWFRKLDTGKIAIATTGSKTA